MSPSWGYLAYLDLDPELKHPIEWSEDQRTERESNKMSTNHLGAMPLPNSNEQFSAWSEYLGEEKDVDFIEWKKDMVGEATKGKTTVEILTAVGTLYDMNIVVTSIPYKVAQPDPQGPPTNDEASSPIGK